MKSTSAGAEPAAGPPKGANAAPARGAIRRGTNLPRLGGFNESVVLDAIRRHPEGLSRVELAGATGLSAQTITNITRRLLDRGIARESGRRSVGSGKPRTLLRIVSGARYAIGVHLDPAVLTYVLLDLLGTVTARRREPAPYDAGPERVVAGTARSVSALLAESGVDRDRVLGLGIAAPGPVDLARGLVVGPPGLPGWGTVALRERLSEATGLPVLLDKDVIAAAVAEHWTGATTDSRDFLFCYLGTGSGMGLVVDDSVLRGSSGNLGETGGLCAACSTRALVDEAVELGALDDGFSTTVPRDAHRGMRRLAELVAEGEPRACGLVDRWGVRIGRGAGAVADLLDSATVVFGGPVWPLLGGRLLPAIEPVIAASPFVRRARPVAVTSSAIGEDVAAVGAACLVLDQALSAQPKSLLLG
ncbi:ROK family protein [Streptomyces sp. NPDC049954]|uniref:ROK family protein n=1 Tax=Streptomyces sp. NPDC049954 TaxID=3155779 RepID=UPI00341C069B